MTGRISGLKDALTTLLLLGGLGVVVTLSALGHDSGETIKAAPDDLDHARNCEVCRSPNHFGGMMPGPMPSREALDRMLSDESLADSSSEIGEEIEIPVIEPLETVYHHKLKSQRDFQITGQPALLHPRASLRRASAG